MDNTEFRNLVRDFVHQHIKPNIVRWELIGEYPVQLHQFAGQAKILSLGMEPDESILANVERRLILVEELARSGCQAVTMALASHFISLNALYLTQALELKAITRQVLTGEKLIVLAVTEPQAGSDLRRVRCTAEHDDGDWYWLSGEKFFICNAERADYVVVAAKLEGKLSLFLASLPQAGVEIDAISCMGWHSLPMAALSFDRVRARLLGTPGTGGKLLQTILLQERANLAVMAIASAELSLESAISYARTRISCDQPLISHQHIRHRLAELYSKVSVCRAYIDATLFNRHQAPFNAEAVAIAKNRAVAVLEEVAFQCVQIHGAAGCTSDSLPARIYRDARLLGLGGGSTEMMNEIISRSFDTIADPNTV